MGIQIGSQNCLLMLRERELKKSQLASELFHLLTVMCFVFGGGLLKHST